MFSLFSLSNIFCSRRISHLNQTWIIEIALSHFSSPQQRTLRVFISRETFPLALISGGLHMCFGYFLLSECVLSPRSPSFFFIFNVTRRHIFVCFIDLVNTVFCERDESLFLFVDWLKMKSLDSKDKSQALQRKQFMPLKNRNCGNASNEIYRQPLKTNVL